jgi:DNA-directed RNA polymerase subunit M/transcription elongation factor TFIIS
MQTVLLSSSPTAKSNVSATQDKNEIHERSSLSDSLYKKSSEPRQFSKLRGRKFETSSSGLQRKDDTHACSDCGSEKTSYSQFYWWSIVARVAKALLEVVMVGDNDDIHNENVSKSKPEEVRTGKKSL